MLQIVEILQPAEQGRTTPFLCRGEDDRLYYVKGRNAGRRSQWCEWLAGSLGRSLGLPIPPVRIVEVPVELLTATRADWRGIGAGAAFASAAQPLSEWSDSGSISLVPAQVRRDVLVFDWWIRNQDRTAGNTNLLWDGPGESLMVIDHNLAFDADFSPASFLDSHVFKDDWNSVYGDAFEQESYLV